MKKRRFVFGTLIAAIAVLLAMAIILAKSNGELFYSKTESPRCNIAISDDGTFYKMGYSRLKEIKGKPYKVTEFSEGAQFTSYYKESVYGYEADVGYTFLDTFLGSKLCGVDMEIEVDSQNAEELFYCIYENMENYYKNRKRYYNDGVVTLGTDMYYVKLGIDGGLYGGPNEVSIEIKYKDGVLTVWTDYFVM